MNFGPAIACLVEASAELGQKLAHFELLAETELEKARITKYMGDKDVARGHLLARRKYEAEATRLRKLLHDTEELIGRFQTITTKYKLLTDPVSPELEIVSNMRAVDATVYVDYELELEAINRQLDNLD